MTSSTPPATWITKLKEIIGQISVAVGVCIILLELLGLPALLSTYDACAGYGFNYSHIIKPNNDTIHYIWIITGTIIALALTQVKKERWAYLSLPLFAWSLYSVYVTYFIHGFVLCA